MEDEEKDSRGWAPKATDLRKGLDNDLEAIALPQSMSKIDRGVDEAVIDKARLNWTDRA